MLAWAPQDAKGAIRVLETAGAAIMGGTLWADDGQGKGVNVTPVIDGEIKSHIWECPTEDGEIWTAYVRRSASVARDNIPQFLRVASEFGSGFTAYMRLEWVTEEQPALFDLPEAVRRICDEVSGHGGTPWGYITWAGLTLGTPVRRACPTAPGSFYASNAATSCTEVPRNAAFLCVGQKASDLERLADFEGLETLRMHGVGKTELTIIGRLPSVRRLSLTGVTTKSLDPLAGLHRLEHFECRNSATLTSLEALSGLKRLRTVGLEHLRKLAYLEEASRLTRLTGLMVGGSTWTHARVPSLVPLTGLQNLRRLHLSGVRVADGSLHPLTALRNLRALTVSNWFRTEEFAKVAVAFPNIEEGFQSVWWVPPRAANPFDYDACKRCKAFAPGMTIGKPARHLCPRCDEAKIAKLTMRWEALVQAAKRRPE
jgi:hypothetical protein